MVIYEVLSGNAPFATHGVVSVIHKVTAGRRPERPQGTEGAWFVDRLWDTLRLCWAHQPEGRPAIQDVLECLERVSRDRKPLPSVDENAANSSQAPLNEGCFDVGGNGAKSKFFPSESEIDALSGWFHVLPTSQPHQVNRASGWAGART